MLFARTLGNVARAAAVVCALSLLAIGCSGGKVEMKEIDKFAGVADNDVTTVKGHLDKAGITGEIIKVEDLGTEGKWLVLISDMKPAEPGKRAALSPPKSYEINKTTGAVKQAM